VVTHQPQVKRRTGKVRRPKTDVLPLCHATNRLSHNAVVRWDYRPNHDDDDDDDDDVLTGARQRGGDSAAAARARSPGRRTPARHENLQPRVSREQRGSVLRHRRRQDLRLHLRGRLVVGRQLDWRYRTQTVLNQE